MAIVCTRGKVRWGRTLRAVKESGFNVTEIVSWPRNKMVASLRELASRRNINLRTFKTNWHQSGLDAPNVRDRKLLQYADCLIVIWDYRSPDIRELLSKAYASNVPTYVYLV